MKNNPLTSDSKAPYSAGMNECDIELGMWGLWDKTRSKWIQDDNGPVVFHTREVARTGALLAGVEGKTQVEARRIGQNERDAA